MTILQSNLILPAPSSFGKVAVLMGGCSSEREVSLDSGRSVFASLKDYGIDTFMLDLRQNYISQLQDTEFDMSFIAMHGGYGEGGELQAVLKAMGKPFTGSNHLACALALNKILTKAVWQANGLSCLPTYKIQENNIETIADTLNYPLAIKPCRDGSTLGISKVCDKSDLKTAYYLAKKYDDEVFAENWIEGEEYTVAILAGQALPSIKIVPEKFYDFNAKYISDKTQFFCPSGLNEVEEYKIRELAILAYNCLGCNGWGRVDFMKDKNGDFWLLELNTVPGLTNHSLVPRAAKSAGINYQELCVSILAASNSNFSINELLPSIKAYSI